MEINEITRMFQRKYANILRQHGASDALEGMRQAPHRQAQTSFDDQLPATRGQLRGLAKQQVKGQHSAELERRKQLAKQIGSPIGGYLGKELGGLVSDIAGERSAPGIKGWLGFKEQRINPEKAQEVGQLLGNIGGGALAGHIAERLQANPEMDSYMDQLGL